MTELTKLMVASLCILATTFGTLPIPALAQGPVVDHSAGSCVTTEGFPKFSASISGNLARPPRFLFRCEPIGDDLYYVEMTQLGAAYQAVLPTPIQPPCESVAYYIEAIDGEGNPAQSPMSHVVVTRGDCDEDRLPAGAAPDITVFDSAGMRVASVPGFAPPSTVMAQSGGGAAMAQGGGGIMSGVQSIVTNPWFWVGVGGAAAGVTAIVLATQEEEEASPTR